MGSNDRASSLRVAFESSDHSVRIEQDPAQIMTDGSGITTELSKYTSSETESSLNLRDLQNRAKTKLLDGRTCVCTEMALSTWIGKLTCGSAFSRDGMPPLRLTKGVPGGVAGGVSGRRGQGRVCGLAGALRLLGINLEDPSVELRDIEYAMQ